MWVLSVYAVVWAFSRPSMTTLSDQGILSLMQRTVNHYRHEVIDRQAAP
jgi:hypothetical protein